MDNKKFGLTCTYRFLDWLDPDDAHRIIGLEKLDLGQKVVHTLENFRLENLTDFTYMRNCTDSDLKLVAKNCKMLSRLDVSCSDKVTDVGLLALIRCSDLLFVDVASCSVTHNGIHQFLTANETVRDLTAGYGFYSYSIRRESFSPPESEFPSIEWFWVDMNHSPRHSLQLIGVKSPHFKSLLIESNCGADLAILESLSELPDVEIISYVDSSWTSIERLISFVGGNIKDLSFTCERGGGTSQRDLDWIFKHCVNLERLEFHVDKEREDVERLVVPPFPKLRYFDCWNLGKTPSLVEFGEMPELEVLVVHEFDESFDKIKSMIFDHTRFPKLKNLASSRFGNEDEIRHLRQIARINNLDIEFKDAYNEDD